MFIIVQQRFWFLLYSFNVHGRIVNSVCIRRNKLHAFAIVVHAYQHDNVHIGFYSITFPIWL